MNFSNLLIVFLRFCVSSGLDVCTSVCKYVARGLARGPRRSDRALPRGRCGHRSLGAKLACDALRHAAEGVSGSRVLRLAGAGLDVCRWNQGCTKPPAFFRRKSPSSSGRRWGADGSFSCELGGKINRRQFHPEHRLEFRSWSKFGIAQRQASLVQTKRWFEIVRHLLIFIPKY